MKKTNFLLLCLAAVLCISCQGNLGERSNRLFFRVSMTRGAAITTETFNAAGQSFLLNGYLEEAGREEAGFETPRYIVDATFEYDATNTCWASTDPNCMWRAGIYTNFWAYSPAILAHGTRVITHCCEQGSAATDDQLKTMSFTYTMPDFPADSAGAEILDDMVFAYVRQAYNGSNKIMNIGFSHPVSAVAFKQGEIPAEYDIKCITLKGFHTSGTCTLTGIPTAAANVVDSISYVWSNLSGASDNTGYLQSIKKSELPLAEDQELSGKKIFMVIPQQLTDTAQVTVVFTKDDSEFIRTATLGGPSVTWMPGKKYAYQLSFDGKELFAVFSDEDYQILEGNWD